MIDWMADGKEEKKILYIGIDRDIIIIYWLSWGVGYIMKKKVNSMLEENLHKEMKLICFKARKICLWFIWRNCEGIHKKIRKSIDFRWNKMIENYEKNRLRND